MEYRFEPCTASSDTSSTDQLKLLGYNVDDDPVALLDYAQQDTNTCKDRVNDRRVYGSGVIPIGEAYRGCDPQLAVFAKGHAMVYNTADEWKNEVARKDIRHAKAQGPVRIHLNVWLPRKDTVEARKSAINGVNQANAIYDHNRAGIAFSTSIGSDPYARVRKLPRHVAVNSCDDVVDLKKCSVGDEVWKSGRCAYVRDRRPKALEQKVEHTQDGINLYIAHDPPQPNFEGKFCATEDEEENSIVINKDAPLQTIGHELGHAFGLDGEVGSGWRCSNLMMVGAEAKQDLFSLTLGQVFRMNVSNRSKVNSSGYRTGEIEESCTWGNFGDRTCPKRKLEFR